DDRERALFTPAADDEWHAAARRQGIALGVPQRVVTLVDRHPPSLPERANDARPALEAIHPLLQRREGDAEHRMLALMPAGADAEVEPATGEIGDRRRALREQRGMIKRQRGHERTEPDPSRAGRQPCE